MAGYRRAPLQKNRPDKCESNSSTEGSVHENIQGMKNKELEVELFMDSANIDILCITEHWLRNGVFCDLSKAFDCVNHETLTRKLHDYGVTGRALDLLKSYLTYRVQKVDVNNMRSSEAVVRMGRKSYEMLGQEAPERPRAPRRARSLKKIWLPVKSRTPQPGARYPVKLHVHPPGVARRTENSYKKFLEQKPEERNVLSNTGLTPATSPARRYNVFPSSIDVAINQDLGPACDSDCGSDPGNDYGHAIEFNP
ncbi:hypothetical protein EVAR_37557_1 [Eumeta japonica]|uniref:Reverse transcriptase domain-containing protein n=1 Tax=Eumeta variegata TaxID=151549 RepID=A0A4C1XVC2_EUMVA|nr:hypothetical protein EVAR_37557_1 [Eumeta japonica]